eukprot:GFYU01001704.1.p1 GENE.GFYU01001704.1~~GFYU01001704.1.p1  ORF type:complete len:108 (+),score=17.97 GFYU01001704.1:168-491(+)
MPSAVVEKEAVVPPSVGFIPVKGDLEQNILVKCHVCGCMEPEVGLVPCENPLCRNYTCTHHTLMYGEESMCQKCYKKDTRRGRELALGFVVLIVLIVLIRLTHHLQR